MKNPIDLLVARLDGWRNLFSGLGTSYDRAAGTDFEADTRIDFATARSLFRGDAIIRKIVSVYPQEALRRGFGELPPDATGALQKLGALAALRRAATWGRLYGGGLIVLGLEDGAKADTPAPAPPCGVAYLDVYARPQVSRGRLYSDRADRRYGQAQTYRVTPVSGSMFEVHRSRCLVFGGVETPDEDREANDGWDDSAIQAPYRAVRAFNAGFLSLENMLTDASQSVVTIKGLISALGADGAEGQNFVAARAKLLDLSRSVARSLLLDADSGESFTKIATQFSGVPETIDRFANLLSASCEIPVTILMGQAPAGLAATGDADTRAWYDRVASYRQEALEPNLRRLLRFLGCEAPIAWPPLWAPSETEAANVRKIDADTDAIYEGLGVITPEEIARSRFAPGGPRPLVIEDPETRRHPTEPEPEP